MYFRDIRQTPFNEQLKLLQTLGDRLPGDSISHLLSFAHTLVTDESHGLGLLDFPIENLPAIVQMLNQSPNIPLYDAINRLYPYKSFLPQEGTLTVEGTLETFQLQKSGSVLSEIDTTYHKDENINVKVGKTVHKVTVPVGNHYGNEDFSKSSYVKTTYHESFLG